MVRAPGIEKLFQGRTPADGVELAERISGDTSVGHALAFCLAVEDALGIPVHPGGRNGCGRSCSSWSASTTMSPTSARSATTSATAS